MKIPSKGHKIVIDLASLPQEIDVTKFTLQLDVFGLVHTMRLYPDLFSEEMIDYAIACDKINNES